MFEDILGEKDLKAKKKLKSKNSERNIKTTKILRDAKDGYLILKEKISVNDRKKFAEFCKKVWDNREKFIESIDENIKRIEEVIGR